MYESYGNVAYSLPKKNSTIKKYGIQSRQYRKRHQAEPKRVKLNSQSEEDRIADLFHRQMARQRIGQIFACIFAVSIIATAFTGILYRSSKILEMNYANVKIENEIKTLEKETNQLKEELSKKTDLRLIRTLAVERLGMQDPGQKQIVQVSIPAGDRLIIESDTKGTTDEDAQLNNAVNNIEGFFKTIR